jgi:hypothetical protein
MYLRIIRPLPPIVEGFDVQRFGLHGGYDVLAPLCDILIVAGYAVPADAPPSSRDAAIKAAADAVVAAPANLIARLEPSIAQDRTPRKKRPRQHR